MARGRGSGKTPKMVVELLKEAVAEKSQSAVARESGLTLLTVQRYLKGIGEPTTATLEKLSGYLGVPVAELRGEDRYFSDGGIPEHDVLSLVLNGQLKHTKMVIENLSSISPNGEYHALKLSLLLHAKTLVTGLNPDMLPKNILQQIVIFISEIINIVNCGDENSFFIEAKKEFLSLQDKFRIAFDKK